MTKRKVPDFAAWRDAMGYSLSEAAEALGLSRSHVINLDGGTSRTTGEPIEPSHLQRLAMAAVAKGLKPWEPAKK